MAIINDILDFSKVERAKMELEPIEFDLERAAHDVTHLLSGKRAEQKRLELILHYAKDCPVLSGMRDVSARYCSTWPAMRSSLPTAATSYRGELQNRLGRTDSHVHLAVQDTGIGISPDAQKTLFRSFTQADASTTRKYGGTGLGLAISKQLVELMGGTIGLHSTPGGGSTFWVEIPLPVAETPAPLPQADLRGVHVLAVDDNPVNRRVLDEQLSSFGMQASLARDAGSALQLLREASQNNRPVQVIVTDHCMPEMDGEALALACRSCRVTGMYRLSFEFGRSTRRCEQI